MYCIDGMVNLSAVEGEDLMSISSGIVADAKVKHDLLQVRVVGYY